MSDAPLIECPECHKPRLTKLVSAAGFQLKGTGWYATDFKNKGKPEVKSDHTKSDNQSTTEAKTDVKTDTKTDTKSTD